MKRVLSIMIALCMMLISIPAMAETASPEILEWVRAQADALSPDQKVVNVFTWTGYIPDEVVNQFMDETGITINYSPLLGDNEEVRTKISANPDMYDLVICSDYIIGTMADQGLLHEIDPAKIPNYANINPGFQGKFYDPDNKYTIPYTNSIPMLVYNTATSPVEVTGYTDLWDSAFENSLVCVAESRVIIGMAQKKLGMSYNETDPEKLALVKDELIKLRPNIVTLNSDTPHNALISGDASAGFMYGSQYNAARALIPELQNVYPKEGLGYGIDNIVVPAGAQHLDATYIFLNYLLDGQVSAYISSVIFYGNCNTAATEFLPESFQDEALQNLDPQMYAEAEFIMPLDAETQAIYDDIWISFRQ
ncbi:spermidine/putrescine ABC transporter substrate-binding protein [Eubacteriales bacterium OttesenSCG-928-N13]|nr:spermidine/putrescine ABC transporter substrate-binding protein [Eubacteriales bacterium OttesenSCG-928-N13]